jgi:hypothetical protein
VLRGGLLVMAIWETFTKRQKRIAQAGKPEVYQYDDLPETFRMQVVYIWRAAIGQYYYPQGGFLNDRPSPSNQFWEEIHNTMAEEAGLPYLGNPLEDPDKRCMSHLMRSSTSEALDIIDLAFNVIDRRVRRLPSVLQTRSAITRDPDDAIEVLNQRFREHSIGYQYLDGKLVRVDSQFVHAEIVKPALSLLNATGFDGPTDEFFRAFDHYRHGRNKEAMAEALKAFESTMKSICAARKWQHPANATAIPLIGVIIKNGLIPAELESHFAGLRSAMESGLPTISNSTSRHGQGAVPKTVPPHFAAYALHLAASNIVFLVEAHKSLK